MCRVGTEHERTQSSKYTVNTKLGNDGEKRSNFLLEVFTANEMSAKNSTVTM